MCLLGIRQLHWSFTIIAKQAMLMNWSNVVRGIIWRVRISNSESNQLPELCVLEIQLTDTSLSYFQIDDQFDNLKGSAIFFFRRCKIILLIEKFLRQVPISGLVPLSLTYGSVLPGPILKKHNAETWANRLNQLWAVRTHWFDHKSQKTRGHF